MVVDPFAALGVAGNIVQFVDFRPEPAPLLVMEYLPLGSLYDQDRDAPIAVEEAVILFYKGSQGIEYLHS